MGVLLQGAPNFSKRMFRTTSVWCRSTIGDGLKTILSVLQCSPARTESMAGERGRSLMNLSRNTNLNDRASSSSPGRTGSRTRAENIHSDEATANVGVNQRRCVWACTRNEPVIYVGGRPFVLRDADVPLENFQLSERASNLESIEQRLKADILKESQRYGNLLLVHEEEESGTLRPSWVAVDASEVKTVREVWDDIRKEGWRCDYHRIPIAEDQPMENNYLDAYTQIIKEIDPINTAFVANCGLGVRRTSFAMVAAVLVRRRQMILQGYGDPMQIHKPLNASAETQRKASGSPAIGVARSLQAASQQKSEEQSTLQVVKALSASLAEVGGSQAAINVLLDQPMLLNALKNAKDGNYGVIGQLIGLLDNGDDNKKAVDLAIDACSHVINLRHSILESRIRYAIAAPDQEKTNESNQRCPADPCDGRLLLHTETEEGGVVPIWEEASPDDIQTLQDVMSHITREYLDYQCTFDLSSSTNHSRKATAFEDIAALTRAVLRSETQANACIVLNCQLGRGRSTLISILALLVSRWIKRFTKDLSQHHEKPSLAPAQTQPLIRRPLTYHLINSLLRVIPHGLEVKQKVDEAIDQCAGVVNLRDSIEDARIAAEQAEDESVRHERIQNGVNNFRRYFQLIVFQAYLDATPPVKLDSLPTFEEFVRDQPVLSTFWADTDKVDISTITPLQKVDNKSAGQALNEEVQEVVSNRSGSVLSAYTMLKSDMFPGLAAQALSQIEGIPNLRGVNAVLVNDASNSTPTTPWSGPTPPTQLSYFMETWGHVIATSLREEAVCVINGRPHVLRLADQPFTNVETTGISTEAVERMEQSLKQDVIKEIRKYKVESFCMMKQ
ncbi:hypothetical protein L7F22_043859 [Adiantum nelumboides]|nr:hypothetical protein [Adiantum nelumboides]